jgi:microsomal epoxide hydrolase
MLLIKAMVRSTLIVSLLTGLIPAGALAQQTSPSGAADPPQKPLSYYGKPGPGIPGAQNVDHVGVVVPNLDKAIKFFVDVLGADLLWTAGPYSDPKNNPARFDVDPRTASKVAMLRLGPNINLELKEAKFPGQKNKMPGNADTGAPHLAFWVDDLDVASDYLTSKGVRLLAGPFPTAGEPKLGEVIRYFQTSFGMYMELVHRPSPLNYEKQTSARLYGPAVSWNQDRPWTDFERAEFEKMFNHGTVDIRGVKMHYVTGGTGEALVLVGGWPESWYSWRKVMPAFAEHYRVFAFDLPGQGDSDLAPAYDTQTIAGYLHDALAQLGIQKEILVGHDVGAWLAYSYAANYRNDVQRLVLMDAAIPGISPDESFQLSEGSYYKVFQFYWHAVPDLPEQIIAGREREYLAWFFKSKSAHPNAITSVDLDEYTRVYSKPGYMKAGFEYYRAFFTDHDQNQQSAKTPLEMPVLALGGEKATGDNLLKALRASAANVSGGALANCGHYLQEECPQVVTQRIFEFLAQE